MIKKTSLPDDFDVTKYDALEYYDVVQWYRELLWRYRLYEILNSDREKVIAHFQKYVDTLGTFEQFIFDCPLKANDVFLEIDNVVWAFKNPQCKIFYDSFESTKQELIGKPNEADGIVSFTVGEFLRLEKLFERYTKDVFDDNDIDFESKADSIDSTALDSVLFNRTQAIVKIDFTHDNTALISAFRSFIASYRKIIDNRVKYQRVSDEKERKRWWHQERVVPYIDVLIWQKYSDVVLTKPVIKSALEKNIGDVADLRTLEKTANNLLTKTAITTLKKQVDSL